MSIQPANPAPDEQPADEAVVTADATTRQRVLRNPGVWALIVSRFAAVLGITTPSCGVMIQLAAAGAPQIAISLLGATSSAAAPGCGIGGGGFSEAMSRRGHRHSLRAAISCPLTVRGARVPALLVLIFLIAASGHVVTPAVKAATALVTTSSQVAVAVAVISVGGGIGAAEGTAFLATFLVNAGRLQAAAFVSGASAGGQL